MPEPLTGRGNTRTGAIPLCYLLYARKRNENCKIAKKAEAPSAKGASALHGLPCRQGSPGRHAVAISEPVSLYMQEKGPFFAVG